MKTKLLLLESQTLEIPRNVYDGGKDESLIVIRVCVQLLLGRSQLDSWSEPEDRQRPVVGNTQLIVVQQPHLLTLVTCMFSPDMLSITSSASSARMSRSSFIKVSSS